MRRSVRAQQPADGPPPGAGYGRCWLRRLAGYCWRHRRLTLADLGASLVATLVTVTIPLIQRDIVDNAILTRHQPIWPGATKIEADCAVRGCTPAGHCA